MGITTQVRTQNYFNFITQLMFWTGVCFEMLIVVMFLAKLKLVSARQLASGWRYAVVGMVVLVAANTPTVDPINRFSRTLCEKVEKLGKYDLLGECDSMSSILSKASY